MILHGFLDFPHEMGFVEALKTWLYTDEIGLVVDDIHFTSTISFGHSISANFLNIMTTKFSLQGMASDL